MSEENNPVDDWLQSDPKLMAIIIQIEESNKPLMEQAADAFELVSNAYNLPKFPGSHDENSRAEYAKAGILFLSSVFEEVGKLRYLEPNDDPRGIVLCALLNVKNSTFLDIDLCASMYFGGIQKVPKEYVIYFTGTNADCTLHFVPKGEGWARPGVIYGSMIIHI